MNVRSFFQWFFLFFGIALLVFLLRRFGLHTVLEQIMHMNLLWFMGLLIYTALWRSLHALAYYVLCGLSDTRFGAYWVAQIYTNTVSDLLVTGSMGGELTRIYKLSKYYPDHKERFISCTILYNIFYAIAMIGVFTTSGFLLFFLYHLSSKLILLFFISAILLVVLVFVLWILSGFGLITLSLTIMNFFIPVKKIRQYLKRLLKYALPIDGVVHTYTQEHPYRALIFICLMYISRILTIGEFIFVAYALNIPMHFEQAILLNALDSFVRIAFFMVFNGQIGVMEGVSVSFSNILGYSPATLLSISLTQRIKTLLWSAFGVLLMFIEKVKGSFYGRRY